MCALLAGVMICCLLLHLHKHAPQLPNARRGSFWRVQLGLDVTQLADPVQDVLELYASRRTHDGQGVTISSQRR